MTSLWFCTPAWKRPDLSQIVLEQRRVACDRLAELGYEASCVVVADDENLDIARSLGFATVNRDNAYLGRKFNDAYQFAAAEGVDYIAPIGSDSWVDPETIAAMLGEIEGQQIGASRNYAVIDALGQRRTDTFVQWAWTLTAIPTELLAHSGWRPVGENLKRGCDTSMMKEIQRTNRPLEYVYVERHPLEIVAFQSAIQITDFDRLHDKWGVGPIKTRPFAGLAKHYPADLVERMEALYASRRAAV